MGPGQSSPHFLARVFAAPHQCLTDESFVILRGGSADAIAAESAPEPFTIKLIQFVRVRKALFQSVEHDSTIKLLQFDRIVL
jgi:hypothetical protein